MLGMWRGHSRRPAALLRRCVNARLLAQRHQRPPSVCAAFSSTTLPSARAVEDDVLDPDNLGLVRHYAERGAPRHVKEITHALAPAETPHAELPPSQLADLDQLYGVLLEPLPRVPTQRERIDKRRRVVEALDREAFFALPGQNELDPESWAHRIRCLGAQGEAAAASAAVDDMEACGLRGLGPRPDQAVLHALADAHARVGNVEGVEEVIHTAKRRRLPMNAPYYTSLIGAHRRAGTENAPMVAMSVLEEARRSHVRARAGPLTLALAPPLQMCVRAVALYLHLLLSERACAPPRLAWAPGCRGLAAAHGHHLLAPGLRRRGRGLGGVPSLDDGRRGARRRHVHGDDGGVRTGG